jgi:hypothetical protein
MELIRKLTRTRGGSYVLFIPKRWVENQEKIRGKKMIKMRVTLNGSIDCEPVFEDPRCLVKLKSKTKVKRMKIDSPTDEERIEALSKMEVV